MRASPLDSFTESLPLIKIDEKELNSILQAIGEASTKGLISNFGTVHHSLELMSIDSRSSFKTLQQPPIYQISSSN